LTISISSAFEFPDMHFGQLTSFDGEDLSVPATILSHEIVNGDILSRRLRAPALYIPG